MIGKRIFKERFINGVSVFAKDSKGRVCDLVIGKTELRVDSIEELSIIRERLSEDGSIYTDYVTLRLPESKVVSLLSLIDSFISDYYLDKDDSYLFSRLALDPIAIKEEGTPAFIAKSLYDLVVFIRREGAEAVFRKYSRGDVRLRVMREANDRCRHLDKYLAVVLYKTLDLIDRFEEVEVDGEVDYIEKVYRSLEDLSYFDYLVVSGES